MNIKASTIPGIRYLRGIAAMLVVAHQPLEMSNGSSRRFSHEWFTKFGAVFIVFLSGSIWLASQFLIEFHLNYWLKRKPKGFLKPSPSREIQTAGGK